MTKKEFFEKYPSKTLNDYFAYVKKNNLKPNNDQNENSQTQNIKKVTSFISENKELSTTQKRQISISMFGIVSFFLPWISVSLFKFNGSITGFELIYEGFIFLIVFFPIGFVLNAIFFALKKHELLFIRNLTFAIPIIVLLYRLFEVFQNMYSLGISVSDLNFLFETIASSISQIGGDFSFGIGFYGTIISLIGIYLIGNNNQTN